MTKMKPNQTPNQQNPEILSCESDDLLERRRQMLSQLQDNVRYRASSRKRRTRLLLGTLLALVAGTIAWQVSLPQQPVAQQRPKTRPPNHTANTTEPTQRGPYSIEAVVTNNNPAVIDKYVVHNRDVKRTAFVQVISDSQMLDLMAEVDTDFFVGQVNQQWVVFQNPSRKTTPN